MDCDGDGFLDWVCEGPQASVTAILSSTGCGLVSPAPRSSCPAALGKSRLKVPQRGQRCCSRLHMHVERNPKYAPLINRRSRRHSVYPTHVVVCAS